MFHSIISILTTAAVALHAMLGCCAHHDHSCCESHGLAGVVQHLGEHCSHGHEHHHDDDQLPSEDAENDFGRQHDGGQPRGCDEGGCSFTSVPRSNDLELMLTFSLWCQTLNDVADGSALGCSLVLNRISKIPPDPLSKSGSARAVSQVWRL